MIGIGAMNDGDHAACLVAKSARRRDHVKKRPIARDRVWTGMSHLSDHGDSLRLGLLDEDRNVRATHKSSILEPLLNPSLRFTTCQVGHVNMGDQRQAR